MLACEIFLLCTYDLSIVVRGKRGYQGISLTCENDTGSVVMTVEWVKVLAYILCICVCRVVFHMA